MNSMSSKKILLIIGIVVLIAISGVMWGEKLMNPAPAGGGEGKETGATFNSGSEKPSTSNPDPVPPAKSEKLQTFHGYFIDQDCFIAYKNPWEDNKDCLTMESCAASGYGIAILQDDKSFKFYYFDGNFAPKSTSGQDKAAKLINNTKNTDHIYIEVKGMQIKDEKIVTSGQSYGIIQVWEMKEVPDPASAQ